MAEIGNYDGREAHDYEVEIVLWQVREASEGGAT